MFITEKNQLEQKNEETKLNLIENINNVTGTKEKGKGYIQMLNVTNQRQYHKVLVSMAD